MGTINAVRLININYNNNGIRINDETLNFNGESTLISLMNGGGKSVMVQMLSAPFVHSRYRNAKDRPFESYFTGARPSFILVEWLLDGGAGKLMNGFMLRRNQDDSDENPNTLDIVGIISEYDAPCLQDINNLPVVEKTKKEMILKSFSECRNLFDDFKRDRGRNFNYYDMNQYAQSRQYFDRLSEYKIDFREWEEIIKKVNEKESGLSELFADCKDEKGLVEKWLLRSVEKKLDPEGTRIKSFRDILEKYIRQYRKNEAKIRQRDNISLFKENISYDGEKKSAKTITEAYVERLKEEREHERRFADLRKNITVLVRKTAGNIEEIKDEIAATDEEIKRIEYEKYSFNLYRLEDNRKEKENEDALIRMEFDQVSSRLEETIMRLHVLEYVRKNDEYKAIAADYLDKQSAREVLLKKNKDMTPRLNMLGGALLRYHEAAGEELRLKAESFTEEKSSREAERDEKQGFLRDMDENISRSREELGRLLAELDGFSVREDEINAAFQTGLSRNILGRYEEGLLDIMLEDARKLSEKTDREINRTARERDEAERLGKKLFSDRENLLTARTALSTEIEKADEKLETLENEKASRLGIMKLLQVGEEKLFDKDTLIDAIDSRLRQTEASINTGQENLTLLQKELKALTEGEIMELPDEVKTGFDGLGIDMVSGMKWLKNNRYSIEKNRKLVKSNPFLPYALILTEKELQRLSSSGEKIYSSLPVPIIRREKLEEGIPESVGKVIDLNRVLFYVSFNEAFLDEELLNGMIEEKKGEIGKLTDQLSIRRKERDEYYAYRGVITGQLLTSDNYNGTKTSLSEMKEREQELTDRLRKCGEDTEANEKEIKALTEALKRLDKESDRVVKLMEQLERHSRYYDDYLLKLEKKETVLKTLADLNERKSLTNDLLIRLVSNISELERKLSDIKRETAENDEKLSAFTAYRDVDCDESISGMSAEELTSEYNAIKDRFTGDLDALESDLENLGGKMKAYERQLDRIKKKYGLTPDDTVDERYDELLEDELTVREKEQTDLKERKKEELNALEKKIARLDQKREDLLENMKRDTGMEEPLPKDTIGESDFDARKNKTLHHRKELEHRTEELKEKRNGYQSLMDLLADFADIEVTEPVVWERPIEELSLERLNAMQGEMRRAYRKNGDEMQRCRNALSDRLNEIMNISVFSDDYYRKPIEAMIRLLDSPEELLSQIDITVRSYDQLMEKIAVDISMVERERDEISSELLEYVGNISRGLAKIDSNSTINLKERQVKMLQISVPDWQQNRETYALRLRDLIDEMTKAAIAILEKNENPEEYIGLKINVRNLYDVIVGTGNIGIQIYKVEKQRIYPISWSDAARNSGGEGFLSAFIILSSLLYYIRRDENDVFAQKNEGKVLLMDNPFAQTNAEHLLKPLMDLAGKNHTQMICFTGLGGDSIYSRFDNIYVLNLVSAKLNGSLQYLKKEHLKGAEPDNIEVSRIEVYDQITLF